MQQVRDNDESKGGDYKTTQQLPDKRANTSANIPYLTHFCVGVVFAENALPLRQAFLIHW